MEEKVKEQLTATPLHQILLSPNNLNGRLPNPSSLPNLNPFPFIAPFIPSERAPDLDLLIPYARYIDPQRPEGIRMAMYIE